MKLLKLLFVAVVVLFCWGWITHVLIGGMTTSQYLHMLDVKFQQGIITGTESILRTGPVSNVVHNTQTFYGSKPS